MYSDLTCTKKYALTEGPKRGGGGGGGEKCGPPPPPPPPPSPSHFMLATGLEREMLLKLF